MLDRLVPHPRVVDKNQERYVRSEGSQPHTRPSSPGVQCQEEKSPKLRTVKTSRD